MFKDFNLMVFVYFSVVCLDSGLTGGCKKLTFTTMAHSLIWSNFTSHVKQGQVSMHVLACAMKNKHCLPLSDSYLVFLYAGSPSGHAMGSSCVWYVMISSALNLIRPSSAITSVQSLQR